ncbi:host specificity factor TipJ family phage tail protein [Akkermansiaceae bacterium]|nr:host specificity factor TipJ family phage tail protein [Akkermansiaceae bacterium]
MPRTGGIVTVIIIAVVAIAAIAVALLSFKPPNVGDTPEADAVFDLRGQKNQNRLTYPIEDCYGRNKIYPPYASAPYSQYYGNESFQFQLFCLGHGAFDIEEITIGDTSIDSYDEVEWEIIQPGETMNLFPDNVNTSDDVASIELYGTNEDDYTTDGFGPFVTNDVGTTTNRIEIDIVFPNGLYRSRDDGSLGEQTITALFEYQEINDDGDAIGTWQNLQTFSRTLSDNTPQRFTLVSSIPVDRSQVRGRRTNEKNESTRSVNTIIWSGMRAFQPSQRVYDGVTMFALKARATNNLNDSNTSRIGIVATRKLPIWNGSTIPDVDDYKNHVATRSPIWAHINILRSNHGGRLSNEYIDWETFSDEAQDAIDNGINFDWVYNQRTTVWEAVKIPCFINRAVPILNGAVASMVRDKPQTLPSFFISESNSIGEISIAQTRHDINANDGLEVTYIDGDTYTSETVLCLLENDTGENLKKLTLQGVSDRQKAYDLGMYLWSKENYERKSVDVTIGLEGYIPSYGDLTRVQSQLPRWGNAGEVISIDGNTITVDQDLTFEDGKTYQLAIRGKYAQDVGPFTVTAGDSANELISENPIGTDEISFLSSEGPFFVFGESNVVGRLCRITSINPSENEQFGVSLVVDDPRRHADYGTAPAISATSSLPVIPSLPVVTNVQVTTPINSITTAVISWNPALGATSYIVQTSLDGVNYIQVANLVDQTSFIIPVSAGQLWVRVRGVGYQVGPAAGWSGIVGQASIVPFDVSSLRVEPSFTGITATIKWDTLSTATSYIVEVITEDETQTLQIRNTFEVTDTTLVYDITQAQQDGADDRNITFKVYGKNTIGLSEIPATVIASNTLPPVVTGVSYILLSDDGTSRTYRVSWNNSTATDLFVFRIYGSTVNNFTPDPSSQIWQGLATSADITINESSPGVFDTFYFVVSAVDVWETEGETLNYSTQETV